MSIVNNYEPVSKQFSTDCNLSFRINFYSKYDTAPQKFSDWLFEKYYFSENDTVLELGCGNGFHWDEKINTLPSGCKLILSDISDGMVNKVQKRYGDKGIIIKKIDIQSIPYDTDSIDVVIANHMLFHVPDLNKALREVYRVLRAGGLFYAATDSDEGIRPYLHNVLTKFDSSNTAFTEKFSFSLENGMEVLQGLFTSIHKYEYDFPLSVRSTNDLMKWFLSTTDISGYATECYDELYSYFENIRKKKGTIIIPKKSGIFVCSK